MCEIASRTMTVNVEYNSPALAGIVTAAGLLPGILISAALTYLAEQRSGSAPAQPAPRMRTRSLFD